MMLTFILFFIVVFLVGIISGYLENIILKRFPAKLKVHLEEMEQIKNNDPQGRLYPDIIKGDYSLSYIGSNALYFLIITMITSIIEALIFFFSKSIVTPFSNYILLLSFLMVLRLPLLVELFFRGNLYKQSSILNKMRQSGIMYRAYVFRTRPILFGVAIIPLLTALII
jgi:membrane protease YdiL (CAAX protease family)